MSNFTPTDEQLEIVSAARDATDNLLISALAGAAKTSTLVLIAEALTKEPILCLAFNKKIADEMVKRLPTHVMSKTINSLGHGIWSNATGKRLVVDTKKNYTLTKEAFDTLRKGERADVDFNETQKGVVRAKSLGYIPPGHVYANRSLITSEAFAETFEEEPSTLQLQLINTVLAKGIALAYQGQIDFDDQVYCSTLLGGTFPRFPLVLIDEAQDLSLLNHAFLSKLVSKRIIAVGDRNQAIYAFRSALTNSMDELKRRFSMVEKTLTISFRCPRRVVEEAQAIVPEMRYPDWAIEGRVSHLTSWTQADLPEGTAVVCRNNAPLFKLAMRLLRQGRGCKIVGSDVGPQLVRALKGLGDESLSREATLAAIAKWEAERQKKSRAKASTEDKANSLRVFAEFGQTLGEALAYAQHLFAQEGPILLMSGHKAKGGEWDTVVFLDSWRIPSQWAEGDEELQQETNIAYVITTRAKQELIYANLDDFQEEREAAE